jgi:hypothetical protein
MSHAVGLYRIAFPLHFDPTSIDGLYLLFLDSRTQMHKCNG